MDPCEGDYLRFKPDLPYDALGYCLCEQSVEFAFVVERHAAHACAAASRGQSQRFMGDIVVLMGSQDLLSGFKAKSVIDERDTHCRAFGEGDFVRIDSPEVARGSVARFAQKGAVVVLQKNVRIVIQGSAIALNGLRNRCGVRGYKHAA